MLNYWKADAFRIVRSRSFWILTLVSVVAYVAGVFIISGPGYSTDTHVSIIMMIGVLATIFTGLGVYNAIYSQDIKAGAMRVAIGRGTARSRIVAAKLIETIVVTALLGLVYYVVFCFLPLVFGIAGSTVLTTTITTSVLQIVLGTVVYASISSIVSMARQESVTATVVFVLLAAGVVDQLLGLLLKLKMVTSLVGNLTGYLPQTVASNLSMQITGVGTASVSVATVCVYVGYVVVSLVLASWVFSRKELEF
ncbi:MAG: ABC transporter permease subunit [Bifidobacteriaceae bacterium]|jgi:ABC-type transport system involved in multi-copper enzyme maturation permease subunit|nr:ABC transporter permease subunit [Bifidobacteriaceae bacterium]